MTAITPARRQTPASGDTPILGFLQTIHASWLEEVRGILNPARREAAGVWTRWRANQYLRTDFAMRLDHGRDAITGARRLLTGTQQVNRWALGELLDLLRRHLDGAVGICQRPEEFSSMTLKLLVALGHWCDGVEDAMGHVRWNELPPASRRLFETLTGDGPAHGG
ncbi:MAG: hypothetical protein ACREMX_10630 [Gemmatimonadales bacterium]